MPFPISPEPIIRTLDFLFAFLNKLTKSEQLSSVTLGFPETIRLKALTGKELSLLST